MVIVSYFLLICPARAGLRLTTQFSVSCEQIPFSNEVSWADKILEPVCGLRLVILSNKYITSIPI